MCGFFFCGILHGRDSEGRRLFSDYSLSLEEGKLTLLEGPSGSGKSTMLRQIAGLEAAPDARRLLRGEEFSSERMSEWRARVTMLSQDAPVLEGSVEANLAFPYRLKAAKGREFDGEGAEALMERIGLGEIPLSRNAASLSGGERHRLALVRALLWDPPVLLADEPLSGLDAARAGDCFQLLCDFAHRPGHAMLCVLHDPALGRDADMRITLGPAADGALPGLSP